MRKFIIPLIAIMFLFGAVEGYAVDKFVVGNAADENLVKITETGIFEGARGDYTVVTTNDTLTAIESGIVEIVEGTSSPVEITLPTASLGLRYTIVAGASDGTIEVQPQDTDTIVYSVSNVVLDQGDDLDSSGTTGDSVTLICGVATKWFVESMKGTWVDGGAD